MRKIVNTIILSIIIVLTPTTINSQSSNENKWIITKIKDKFKEINNFKNYQIVTIEDADEFLGHGTDNGAALTGYFKKDSLKKITEWVGLSNRVVQNEYYLDSGKLIFVHSKESYYKFDAKRNSFDYSKLETVYEGRFYFHNTNLLKSIISDKFHSHNLNADTIEIWTSYREYPKLLRSKIK